MTELEAENQWLRAENVRLKMEREILKPPRILRKSRCEVRVY